MAATAAMMHGGYQSVNNAARIHQVQHSQQLQRSEQIHHTDHQPAQAGEPEISTFFCRALYDYRSNDSSSLSFYRGDIIEVLTQLESGWWDGLLNDERGWFPSNYVSPISDSEAEAELGPLEYSMRQTETEVHDSAIDVGQIQRNHSSNTDRDHGWIQEDAEYSNSRDAFEDLVQVPTRVQGAPNDFWLPQVDGSGQIYYLNTHTGERSRDLPTENVEAAAAAESDLGEYSSSNSRAGSRLGGRSANTYGGRADPGLTGGRLPQSQAGFGVTRRGGTPEPWEKRLADDGLTYYYYNPLDGQTTWTRPVATNGISANTYQEEVHQNARLFVEGPSTLSALSMQSLATSDTLVSSSRLRADSTTSHTQAPSSKRESVYSDDSDIHPRELEQSDRFQRVVKSNGNGTNGQRDDTYNLDNDPSMTPAEHASLLLQNALAVSEPEAVETLSDATREAIIAVMAAVDDSGIPKAPDNDREIEMHVGEVVVAVRNLLYVSCALSGPLPNNLGERSQGDPAATAVAQQLQASLKQSQRKVTATLSKLVLSARAARYKREVYSSEMMVRVEQDAADLQRAVDNFVTEVKKQYARTAVKQLHQRIGRKRLRGVFACQNLGIGLPGAGNAASWKGFGFFNVEEGAGLPKRNLNDEAIDEGKVLLNNLDEELARFASTLHDSAFASDDILDCGQTVLAHIQAFVLFIMDINVCQDIDVDGLRDGQPGSSSAEDPYLQIVERARFLLRSLEVLSQSLYEDGATLLTHIQTIPFAWGSPNDPSRINLENVLESYVQLVKLEAEHSFEYLVDLLDVSREQIASEVRYRESMALRVSRISIFETNGRLSNFFTSLPPGDVDEAEDVVDMETAFRKGATRPPIVATVDDLDPVDVIDPRVTDAASHARQRSAVGMEGHKKQLSEIQTSVPGEDGLDDDLAADFLEEKAEKPRATKIRQLLGPDAPERYIEIANADQKPWYLRSEHNKEELIINPDGGIRAGTLPALIERLTSHEYGDPVFIRTFLMTYKSFTTLNELFDLLLERYRIQPPDGLSASELDDWTKLKQHVVRSRVLNTFKTMVTDDQVLVDDDMYILERIKDFLSEPDVSSVPAAKTLMNVIDRKKQGNSKSLTATPPSSFPPPSIIPKGMNKNKLKLLDIDPLEVARQITIMESNLYKKIKAIECLQRSREQKVGEHRDHITDVIQMTNKIANWVNSTILSKEDSRKRAALVKQFISIADRCRNLHNFSSMAAIISGLNSPPIRRLKRTWEQVSGRFMSQLGTCEMTLDSSKNFTNYKATLAQVNPPCIPFIGVYLTTLTFIQDGSKDTLPGNLINFGKRQRAAEIIREIQHWQSKDFNLAPLPPILAFIEEALGAFNDSVDWGEQFWNISLEREPREREDEKMARLLQESGFL